MPTTNIYQPSRQEKNVHGVRFHEHWKRTPWTLNSVLYLQYPRVPLWRRVSGFGFHGFRGKLWTRLLRVIVVAVADQATASD